MIHLLCQQGILWEELGGLSDEDKKQTGIIFAISDSDGIQHASCANVRGDRVCPGADR